MADHNVMVDQPQQPDPSDTMPATAPSGPMPPSNSKPRRRWYQFSLRTLLVGMLVGSVAVGWVASRIQRARANRERAAAVEEATQQVIAWIEKVGGKHDATTKALRPQT